MSPVNLIPFLPESAPFTAEQRAYLNGFLAGLFSRVPDAPVPNAPPTANPLKPLTILIGSQTGTAEKLAKRIGREAGRLGFAPTLHEMSRYPTAQLASERNLLIVTSTYGDGEPPDNAKAFWQFLSGHGSSMLSQTRFSVCALGDSNYPNFCAFGKSVDIALEKLGGQRVSTRADCDVDYEQTFQAWLSSALTALAPADRAIGTAMIQPGSEADEPGSKHDRNNPFSAPLLVSRRLNGEGSTKDTRHIAFSLAGSDLAYEAGDALGIMPANCPRLVDELVASLGARGDEAVPLGMSREAPLFEALRAHYDIARVSPALLKHFADKTGDALLVKVSAPETNGELSRFLRGREVIDLLLAYPQVRLSPTDFVALLKKLQPRLYSIASSPKAHPGEVHLCVGVVRYESLGRARQGVCSTFLADRLEPGSRAPVYVHANPNFRPPANPERPLIMVGPGTGIAPFRAFLEERKIAGATGRNWLFFGDQRSSTDFLFRDEIEAMRSDGVLHRLDLAFSRDQEQKIYVQDRMLEHAKELFAWIEEGSHFCVCGDASRMAKDVDAALKKVIESAGGKTPAQAAEYVSRLEVEQRYVRDVY
jgi:sulfite reductase (NADPH) flavoprotein alpha-component